MEVNIPKLVCVILKSFLNFIYLTGLMFGVVKEENNLFSIRTQA